MYASPPVIVPLTYFLRKSAWRDPDEEWENLARTIRRNNPLFLIPPALIILGPGPGGGQLGIPTLTGGQQRLQIFIAGSEVTNASPSLDYSLISGLSNSVGAQPLHISSQTIGRWSAEFDLFDPTGTTLNIELGQTVLIQENGVRVFVGCIVQLTPEIFEGADFTVYHVHCIDKSGIFDHRIVLAKFFLAGTDAADCIRQMFNDPSTCNPPLSQEGISLNNLPVSLGQLTTDIPINLDTVTTIMDKLLTDVVGIWWIDTTNDLHAQTLSDLGPAPFSISATSRNFRKASMTTTLFDYRTKQYAVSDRNVTPPSTSTGITGTPITETWTLPQQLALDLGYLRYSVITNFQILKITSLKVNGVSQPFYLGTDQINFRHVWWYFPQTPYLIPPNIQGQNPFPDPALTSADPVDGDVIEIQYIAPQQQSQVVTADPLAPAFGTCGSGVYEVVEQVKGITSQNDLNAIAQAILERSGGIPKQFKCETDQFGLQVGQKLPVDLPRLDISNLDLLITSLDATAEAKELEFGSRFRWQVMATNTTDLGNWIKWWERLIRRTDNAIPVDRYEEASWVLSPGGSLSSGVVTTNPYIVRNTGQVFLGFAAAGTAPIDQSLTLDVVSQQQGSIFSSGPTPLVIPAGSTALVKITQFTGSPAPFWLYRDDILTVTATYGTPGADPTNAANVTMGLRLSY